MKRRSLLTLMALSLLAPAAACDRFRHHEPVDPEVEQSCREEGFDPETTEFADCVKELSGAD